MAATGQAGGDAGQQQQGQAQQDAGQQQGGLDMAQLQETLQGFSAGQDELRQQLQQLQQQPQQPDGEPAGDDADLDLSELYDDPEATSKQINDVVQKMVAEGIQQTVSPLQEKIQQFETEQKAMQLAAEFPELQDRAVADEVFKNAQTLLGNAGLPQEFAGNLDIIRLVYMAGRGAEAANAEGDQPDAAHLEGGTGALPGQNQADLVQQMFGTDSESPGRKILPF